MHAPGSSRTVLFDVGGVLVDSHPDPAVIARMFGDESRGLTTLVDQAMWTHRGDYDAGLSDRDFWDRIAGDCGQDEPPADLLKALVELDSSRMADANESTLSLVRSCDTRAYASASSPTPRTPSQKQSAAPNGGASSTSSPSPATTASASPPVASTATYSTASELPSKTSPSSTTVAKMFAPLN